MKLQNIIFPQSDACTESKLFFQDQDEKSNLICDMQQQRIIFPKGATASFDTYFNSFSISKWAKYTIVDNVSLELKLEGSFELSIYQVSKWNGSLNKQLLDHYYFEDVCGSVNIRFPKTDNKGLYYFKLKSHSDNGLLRGGQYYTDIEPDDKRLQQVHLALDICTFKREDFIKRNISILNKYLLEDKHSELYGNLDVFIADNGRSLPTAELTSEHISIYPNKNVGGAGGFTRGLMEILKHQEQKNITHVVMMDDDIKINTESLVRTFLFLKVIKAEHRDSMIGGAMLRLDQPHIQSESGDYWTQMSHFPVKYKYNLTNINFLVKNEIEDSINHFGWWYCCMPMGVISKTNLPLPLFIKRDDMEYGLRNGRTFITLNGIAVWHEPFEAKRTSYLEYYYIRNTFIINSIHRPLIDAKGSRKWLWQHIVKDLLCYRYQDAHLRLQAAEDFLKGIDWLKNTDGEALNTKILKMSYQKQPIADINAVFVHGAYEAKLQYKESSLKKKIRRITLNGWLLPAQRVTKIIPAVNPKHGHLYRVKRAVNFEESSGLAFVTVKSYRQCIQVLKRYRRLATAMNRNFEAVKREYNKRYRELTNLDFWNRYLDLEQDKTTPKSAETTKSKKTAALKWRLKDIPKLCYIYIRRFLQFFMQWIPVKKHKVLFYIHRRPGYTCNLKYISQYLMNHYSENLELVWASEYPDTCQEQKEQGIKVIKATGAAFFRELFTSHVIVYNDALPAYLLRRRKQFYINTWHAGMNYKRLGKESIGYQYFFDVKNFELRNQEPDLMISGSAFFTQDTAKSFEFDESIFIGSGLPRNDIFFSDNDSIKGKVKEFYGISPDTKILLYAPTFRKGHITAKHGIDFKELRQTCENKFGGKWVVFTRSHQFVNKAHWQEPYTIDASSYDDMQELLYTADILVSDYSSCLWDFTNTGRPALVYANDVAKYDKQDRSFAYPIEKWPYPLATCHEELISEILTFDLPKYQKRVQEHHQALSNYDKGCASQKIGDIIYQTCYGKSLHKAAMQKEDLV